MTPANVDLACEFERGELCQSAAYNDNPYAQLRFETWFTQSNESNDDAQEKSRTSPPSSSLSPMEIVRRVVVFDAADVNVESAFWASVLNGNVVDDDEDFHCVIDATGAWCIGVQSAPNHVSPQWPDGVQQQQVHLDLHVDDPRSAHQEMLRLGARLLQPAVDLDAEEGHQVYADPAGHPFCVGWGHPSPSALANFLAARFGNEATAS